MLNYIILSDITEGDFRTIEGTVGDFDFVIRTDNYEKESPFVGTKASSVSVWNRHTLKNVFFWIKDEFEPVMFSSQEVENFVRTLISDVCGVKKIVAIPPKSPEDLTDDFI